MAAPARPAAMIGPALSVQEKALLLPPLRPELLPLERFELRLEERLWVRVAMEHLLAGISGCSTVGGVPPFLLRSAFKPPFAASFRVGWRAPAVPLAEELFRLKWAAPVRVHSSVRSPRVEVR